MPTHRTYTHTANRARLFATQPQGPAWIRKTRVEMPAEVVQEELDAPGDAAVDLWTSLVIESPGFPAIAGVAAEVIIEDEAATHHDVVVYYYTYAELATLRIFSTAYTDTRRYHEHEEEVTLPPWLMKDNDDREVDQDAADAS